MATSGPGSSSSSRRFITATPRPSATLRVLGTTELLEMILLAIIEDDVHWDTGSAATKTVLVAQKVNQTFRGVIKGSGSLQRALRTLKPYIQREQRRLPPPGDLTCHPVLQSIQNRLDHSSARDFPFSRFQVMRTTFTTVVSVSVRDLAVLRRNRGSWRDMQLLLWRNEVDMPAEVKCRVDWSTSSKPHRRIFLSLRPDVSAGQLADRVTEKLQQVLSLGGATSANAQLPYLLPSST